MSLRFLGDLPAWFGGVLAVLIAAAVWWYYRRDTRDSGPLAHWVLPTLRATAIALAIMTLTGPVLRRTTTIGQLGRVVFCVDSSASMTQHDPDHDSTRFDRARDLLTGDEGLLAELLSTHELSVSGLNGSEAELWWDSAETEEPPPEFDVQANALTTDLATPVMRRLGLDEASLGMPVEAAEDAAQQGPRTAVVLFSDGRHTHGRSPIEVATQLAGRGVPLYCVGFGDPHEPTDVAVLELQAPDSVSSKNRVRGTLVWKDRGPPGRTVQATISAGDEVLWQETLTTQDVPLRRTEFDFAVREIVDAAVQQQERDVRLQSLPLVLTARLQPFADEIDSQNNESEFRVSAVVNDHRLLLIDGRSRWETRYLRNLFQRDEAWQVNTLIVGPSSEHKTLPRGEGKQHFPSEPAGLLDYDLIILGEVNADVFSSEEQGWIRDYVARGGGLVIIDGPRGKWKQLVETPLGDLVPVAFTDALPQRSERLQLTPSGLDWSPLRLRTEREPNRQLWQQLPPPQMLVNVEPLPGAEMVAEAIVAGKPRPAIVRRPFGAGQVVYFAFEDSWRWRYEVADQFHVRFWNQLGKAVMQAPFAVSDSFASLDTGRAQYNAGDAADIRVRLRDANGRPISDATADALLWRDDELVATISLAASEQPAGMYRGTTGPLLPGVYRTTVRASGYSESALKVKTEFRVTAVTTGEFDAVSCNEPLLREMALASGGQYLPEASAADLKLLLEPLSSGRTEQHDTLLWRSYWWFWAILGLLSVEWLLRKRSGLL